MLSRFGNIVHARRTELDLSQQAVRAAGGPSQPTLIKIERGDPPGPTTGVLDKLDLALRWTPGSAAEALAGGAPTDNTNDQISFGAAGVVPMPIGDLTKLLDAFATLREELSRVGRRAEPKRELVEHLMAVGEQTLGKLASDLVTRILELNKDAPLAMDALANILRDQLRIPALGPTPSDKEAQRYRRWLTGDLPDATDDEVRRWRARADKNERDV